MAYPLEKQYITRLEDAQRQSLGGQATNPPAPELPSRYMAHDPQRPGGSPPPDVLNQQKLAVLQALLGQQGPNSVGMGTGSQMGNSGLMFLPK